MRLSVFLSVLLFPIRWDSEKCSHEFSLTISDVFKINKDCLFQFCNKAVGPETLHIARDTVFQLKTKNYIFSIYEVACSKVGKSFWLKATSWDGFLESSELHWLACLKMYRKLPSFNRTNCFMFQYVEQLRI